MTTMRPKLHDYAATVVWDGNRGEGTATYAGYDRDYRALIDGKPPLAGSADPAFRGRSDRHNPEDLFVTALAACHMLAYLALCARQGVRVLAYADEAVATLATDASGGRFERVELRPRVTVADPEEVEQALALHDAAHARCFIANSCSVPITHRPTVVAAGAPEATTTGDPDAADRTLAGGRGAS